MLEGSWAGSVIVTDGSGADPGGPKKYGSESGCWSGSLTLMLYYLPCAHTQDNLRRERGPHKKTHNGPQIIMQGTLKTTSFLHCRLCFNISMDKGRPVWLYDCVIACYRYPPLAVQPRVRETVNPLFTHNFITVHAYLSRLFYCSYTSLAFYFVS